MTKSELIKKLETMDDDKVITLYLGEGWANVEKITETVSTIDIHAETNPVFDD